MPSGARTEMVAKMQQGGLIGLATTLVSILLIIVIGLIVYFIYLMIMYYYPRPFLFGHSEPLEQFMEGYIPDLIDTMKAVNEIDKIAVPNSIFEKKSEYDPSRYIIPASGQQGDPEGAPLLYLYFALGDDYSKKSVAGISSKLVPKCSLAERITDDTYMEVNEEAYQKFKNDMKWINDLIHTKNTKDGGVFLPELLKNRINSRDSPEDEKLQSESRGFGRVFGQVFGRGMRMLRRGRGRGHGAPPPGDGGDDDDDENDDDENDDAGNDDDVEKLQHMRLNFLLDKNQYIKNIHTMYDFRKNGGLENMTLLKVTMMDYIKYVWVPPKGVVPKTWMKFGSEIESKKNTITDWIRSPRVNEMVMTLPATIGGIKEDFVDAHGSVGTPVKDESAVLTDVIEHLLLPPHTKPGDHVEEFGFLKGLLQLPKIFGTIMKFFVTLMDVAKALANSIANPIKALRLIIGMIVGVIMVIIYFVVVTLDFVFYGPAFIWVLVVSILATIGTVSLFVVQAAFFLLLWVLDIATGGLFLKIMRCENLPSKWHMQPGWFYDNKYLRGFMCNFTCSERFLPEDGGSWCTRISRGRPSYCPQQILYNAATVVLNKSSNPVVNKSESSLVYKFVIPSSYYTMDEVNKKTKIVQYIQSKAKYIKHCYQFNKEYSKFAVIACKYFHGIKLDAETWERWALNPTEAAMLPAEVQKQVEDNKKLYDEYQEIIDKAMKVCVTSHCGQSYLKGLDINDLTFCPNDEDAVLEKEIDNGSEGKSMTQMVIYSSGMLSILMVTFVAMYYYARDRNFNFHKLWNNSNGL